MELLNLASDRVLFNAWQTLGLDHIPARTRWFHSGAAAIAQNDVTIPVSAVHEMYTETIQQVQWFTHTLPGLVHALLEQTSRYTGVPLPPAAVGLLAEARSSSACERPRTSSEPLILAVTGHRPSKLGGYGETPQKQWVRQEMRKVLIQARDAEKTRAGLVAMSGMAIGVDTWFAELALELGIPLWATVPFEGHHRRWPEAAQRRHHSLLEQAWRVTVLQTPAGPLDSHTVRRYLLDRNTWMVKQCDRAFAVWTGVPGGTAHCVGQLEAKGKPTLRFNPDTRTVGVHSLLSDVE